MVALSLRAASRVAEPTPTVPPVSAKGYGSDPQLNKFYTPGDAWPLTLSKPQRAAAIALADVLLPADDLGPAPTQVRVIDFVRACRAAGIKTAVASSADMIKVKGNLEQIGLVPERDFDAVVCGEDVQRKKPAPDIFLLAAKRIGIDPKECLVVEDAPSGVKAGAAAGACRDGWGVPGPDSSLSGPGLPLRLGGSGRQVWPRRRARSRRRSTRPNRSSRMPGECATCTTSGTC